MTWLMSFFKRFVWFSTIIARLIFGISFFIVLMIFASVLWLFDREDERESYYARPDF